MLHGYFLAILGGLWVTLSVAAVSFMFFISIVPGGANAAVGLR
jgi:hypothetical protein